MRAVANPRKRVTLPRPEPAWARTLVDAPLRLAEHLFGLDAIDAMSLAIETGDPSQPVFDRILAVTGLSAHIDPVELRRIPSQGPVLICCNHPFGGADSTTLMAKALQRRPDVKVITNAVMSRFSFLDPYCIYVDAFGGVAAARRNAMALRDSLAWLRAGHALLSFPAGEVSASSWSNPTPCDPPWSNIPARLALATGAQIVPAWCLGSNRALFHAAGLLHPRLRTALLPNEFLARRGTQVQIRLGHAIATDASTLDATSLTRLVRGRCELLAPSERGATRAAPTTPIVATQSTADELARELNALPLAACLVVEGKYRLYAAPAAAIPSVLRELGRLREIAFRAVAEGTGESIDLDRFDDSYTHLVLWNMEAREVAGGYRALPVAQAARASGVRGLYTSTLFNYAPGFLDEFSDAVELGRSFVRLEYQRQPTPLALLWKGITVFMLLGGYRRMFGSVSISNEYRATSKEILMQFLERTRSADALARLVAARVPPQRSAITHWTSIESACATTSLAQVDRLIDEIERGERAVPIMLRQYLRLNAKMLGFSVDRNFGDVIDALMLVDFAQIEERIIRYHGGDAGVALMRQRFGTA